MGSSLHKNSKKCKMGSIFTKWPFTKNLYKIYKIIVRSRNSSRKDMSESDHDHVEQPKEIGRPTDNPSFIMWLKKSRGVQSVGHHSQTLQMNGSYQKTTGVCHCLRRIQAVSCGSVPRFPCPINKATCQAKTWGRSSGARPRWPFVWHGDSRSQVSGPPAMDMSPKPPLFPIWPDSLNMLRPTEVWGSLRQLMAKGRPPGFGSLSESTGWVTGWRFSEPCACSKDGAV